jgi:uncharacterized protein YdgA (DUF945 family)
MKKGLALLLIVILLALGAYLGCGLLARHTYQTAMNQMQADFPGRIDASYHQGLFTSELDILLHIPIPAAHPDTPPTIAARIRQTIHHGPFIFSGQRPPGRFFMPMRLSAHGVLEVEPFLADEPPLVRHLRQLATTDITVSVPLLGGSLVSFKGRPFTTTVPLDSRELTLEWQGFDGTLTMAGADLHAYDLDFLAPGLTINGPDSAGLAVESLTTRATMRAGNHNLSLGTISTGLQKCEFRPGSDPAEKIALTDLVVRITSSEEEGLFRVEEEINLAHLLLPAKNYGPLNLKISLANLDARAIATLAETYKGMQTAPGQGEALLMTALGSQAAALLATSPEIRLENLSLASPEGAGQASALLAFNGEGEVIMNPFFLLGRLSAEADFSADEHFMAAGVKNILKEKLCGQPADSQCDQEAARAGSKQLQDLVAQNILRHENGKYTLSASFKAGQAVLNGQPMPLAF